MVRKVYRFMFTSVCKTSSLVVMTFELASNPRWAMICCYNAAANDPYKESHHPRYTPLDKVPDSAILEAGLRRFNDSNADVAWLEDQKDHSARSLAKTEDPVAP